VLAPLGEAAFVEELMPIPESLGMYELLNVCPHRIAVIVRMTCECVHDATFDFPAALALLSDWGARGRGSA